MSIKQFFNQKNTPLIFLAGGGGYEDSAELDKLCFENLAENGTILYLPFARDTHDSSWVTGLVKQFSDTIKIVMPTVDYIDLLKATHLLTRDIREVEKMFRLMCFNVFMHNRDDHTKNFSFIYDDDKWSVSPVYDLVYSEGPGGEHTTTIAGNGKNPNEIDILKVADSVGISKSKAEKIINEVKMG